MGTEEAGVEAAVGASGTVEAEAETAEGASAKSWSTMCRRSQRRDCCTGVGAGRESEPPRGTPDAGDDVRVPAGAAPMPGDEGVALPAVATTPAGEGLMLPSGAPVPAGAAPGSGR